MKALIALALSAASAMIYEVVATDALFWFYSKSSYSLATVIAVFLTGLAIGAYTMHAWRPKHPKIVLGWTQFCIALFAALILRNVIPAGQFLTDTGLFVTSVLLLLPPTIAIGATFPLVARISRRDAGLVYAVDLVGAVVGTLLAGFLLIPLFGNSTAIMIGVLCNLFAAMLFMKKKWVAAIAIVAAVTILLWPVHAQVGEQANEHTLNETFGKASPYGFVEIKEGKLVIDGREQCGITYSADATERSIADLALSTTRKEPLKILNIGLGCGLTAERLLEDSRVHLDIVEINPVVLEANRRISDVQDDDRVTIILADGLQYLRDYEGSYDLIIMDIENPTVQHSSPLYTAEAFGLVKERLQPDGSFAIWGYDSGQSYWDILYWTLKEHFAYAVKQDIIFLASNRKIALQQYTPVNERAINTLDHNILSTAYEERT